MKQHVRPLFLALCAFVAFALPVGTAGQAYASTALVTWGTVTAISVDSVSIRSANGAPMTFRLSATTTYERLGQPAQQSDVKVGQYVKVKYHVESDGSLKAKKVKIERLPTSGAPAAHQVQFHMQATLVDRSTRVLRARVRSLIEGRTVVRALIGRPVVVAITRSTVIVLNNRIARLSDLRPGDSLAISGAVLKGTLSSARVAARRVPTQR